MTYDKGGRELVLERRREGGQRKEIRLVKMRVVGGRWIATRSKTERKERKLIGWGGRMEEKGCTLECKRLRKKKKRN